MTGWILPQSYMGRIMILRKQKFPQLLKGPTSFRIRKVLNFFPLYWLGELCRKVRHIFRYIGFKFFKDALFRLANCLAGYAIFVTEFL